MGRTGGNLGRGTSCRIRWAVTVLSEPGERDRPRIDREDEPLELWPILWVETVRELASEEPVTEPAYEAEPE